MGVESKDYTLFFDPTIVQIMYAEYEKRISNVDTGLFTNSINSYTFIHNIRFFSLFVSKDFLKALFRL